jgi:16S rRNA (cytidine1402-2'-O)-methyltransferase
MTSLPESSPHSAPGCLFVVATPIGNLEDISLRALRILKQADLIACEDTRRTRKLLAHFEIRKPLVSYHEHNERSRAAELERNLLNGSRVAIVTDAGTPLLSDPGREIIARCVALGIPVIPIPGPSALTAALMAAGLAAEEFLFAGFLPARAAGRRRRLQELSRLPFAVVLYEAPHRLLSTLSDALELLGDREAVLGRELTKLHEEFLRAPLSKLLQHFRQQPPRGEFTLLISPPSPGQAVAEAASEPLPLAARVAQLEREAGLPRNAAIKQAARERGISRREAYALWLRQRAPAEAGGEE